MAKENTDFDLENEDFDLWRTFTLNEMIKRFEEAGYQDEGYLGVNLVFYKNCNLKELNALDDAYCAGMDRRERSR